MSAPNADADSATRATNATNTNRVLFLIKSPTIMVFDTVKKFLFFKEMVLNE